MVNFEWNLSQHNLFKLWKSLNFMHLNLFELRKNGIKMRSGKSLWTTLLIKIVYVPEQVFGDLLLTNLLVRIIFSSPKNNVLRAKSVCNCGSSDWLRYARNGNRKFWWIIIDFRKNMLHQNELNVYKRTFHRHDQRFFVIYNSSIHHNMHQVNSFNGKTCLMNVRCL